MPADTIAQRDLARATRSLLKGAGAQLAGKKRGPDRRVRRGSVDVDDPRAKVWRPINGGKKEAGLRWRDALRRTAREYDLVGKRKGKHGPLGPHTREVLFALLELVDFATGRLEPSYAKLMAMTGFAKGTIGKALRRLRAHGFVDWVRRSRVVEKPDGEAREQTSNAFTFDLSRLPKQVWRRFRDLLARAEKRTRASMRTGSAPVLSTMPRDPELAAAIAALQARVDQGAE